MPVPSQPLGNMQFETTLSGSPQYPWENAHPSRTLITNTAALTTVTSSQIKQDWPPNTVDLTAAGAYYRIIRDPTMCLALKFMLGHGADANNTTALLQVFGGAEMRGKNAAGTDILQYLRDTLFLGTLTGGNTAVGTSMILAPNTQPTSLKWADSYTSTADYTLSPGVRSITNPADGTITLFFDGHGYPFIDIELSGGTATHVGCLYRQI